MINGNALRPHELTVSVALTTEDSSGRTVWMDHEDVMYVEIGNDDMAFVVEGDASRRVKVATEVPLVAKLAEQDTVVVEDQETMVSRVGDSDPPVELIDGDIIGVDHLSIVSALCTKHE